MLQDGIDGSVSSKRVITLLAFLLCTTAFLANLFWGLKIEPFLYESMSYITMAGLGVTVAEKFSAPKNFTPINTPYVARVRGTPIPRQEDPLI